MAAQRAHSRGCRPQPLQVPILRLSVLHASVHSRRIRRVHLRLRAAIVTLCLQQSICPGDGASSPTTADGALKPTVGRKPGGAARSPNAIHDSRTCRPRHNDGDFLRQRRAKSQPRLLPGGKVGKAASRSQRRFARRSGPPICFVGGTECAIRLSLSFGRILCTPAENSCVQVRDP
jgi:hypothetical protein